MIMLEQRIVSPHFFSARRFYGKYLNCGIYRLRKCYKFFDRNSEEQSLMYLRASANDKMGDRQEFYDSMEPIWVMILDELRNGELIGSGCKFGSKKRKDVNPRLYTDFLPDFDRNTVKIGGTFYEKFRIRSIGIEDRILRRVNKEMISGDDYLKGLDGKPMNPYRSPGC